MTLSRRGDGVVARAANAGKTTKYYDLPMQDAGKRLESPDTQE